MLVGSACAPDPQTVPWHQQEHAPLSLPERNDQSLTRVDRCADAAQRRTQLPQFRERAITLCDRALKALAQRSERETSSVNNLGLWGPTQALHNALSRATGVNQALAKLERQLDRAHAMNDPQLLALVQGRDAPWRASALTLRQTLRSWRRCLQRHKGPKCHAVRTRTRLALENFETTMQLRQGSPPFATRSFQRCVERCLSRRPDELTAQAQSAQSDAMSLRGCERIARRLAWPACS